VNVTPKPYQFSEIKEHLLQSRIVAQTFKIKVQQPISRSDHSERFAVVYATDSDDFFGGLAALANHLQLHGETPRFILVGIGYDNAGAAALLRQRDLHTHAIRRLYQEETQQLADSPLVSGMDDLKVITHTTDASEFLRFIRVELIPFIDANYPTLIGENNYTGYSAGGSFGLYTLFTRPDTFQRYILGSPATSYSGHHFGIELASAFIQSGQAMDSKVFISVGELEEFQRGFGQFELVTGYFLLTKYLMKAAIPGLNLTTRMFPGESHATAWSAAFSHGLKTLFGPVDQVPFWPDYLK